MRRAIVFMWLVWLAGTTAAAAQDSARGNDGIAHLRINDAHLKRLIEGALDTSPTFRDIVTGLDQSSVIVYAQYGRCGSVPACTVFVSAAGPYIYLRATVDPFEKSASKVAGLLAHELQHARELSSASITSSSDFIAFYSTHGRHGYRGFETDAAAAAGARVEREVAATRITIR